MSKKDTDLAAWEQYRDQLEALGVDPYQPDVPEDDERYEQVQAIVNEHKKATSPPEPPPLPPGWEGHPPTEPIISLQHMAKWLNLKWSILHGTKLAGEKYYPTAIKEACVTVRNVFRGLEHLGVDEKPERLPLPETLEDSLEEIDRLEKWIRMKRKSGWQPPATPEPKKPEPKPKVTKEKKPVVPDDEANVLVRQYLEKHPTASSRDVAENVGIALGRVSKMAAWQAEQSRRKALKKTKPKSRRLTKQMLDTIGKENDPAASVEAEEIAWVRLIDAANPEEKARLHGMTEKQRAAIIQTYLESQYQEQEDFGDDEL